MFYSLKKKGKKERKQSEAEVLPQAGSCSGCAFTGQKLQNWEYCQALYQRKQPAQQLEMGSCQLCVPLGLSFSFSLPFSYLYLSISCILVLRVGSAHRQAFWDHREYPRCWGTSRVQAQLEEGRGGCCVGGCCPDMGVRHWARGCSVAAASAAAGVLGRHSRVVPLSPPFCPLWEAVPGFAVCAGGNRVFSSNLSNFAVQIH